MLSFVSIHIGTGIFEAQARGKKKKNKPLWFAFLIGVFWQKKNQNSPKLVCTKVHLEGFIGIRGLVNLFITPLVNYTLHCSSMFLDCK